MAIAMLTASYSALSDKIEVMDPAPAIIGKASGTIEATLGGASSSLNSCMPKIISIASANKTKDPATAKELTSTPMKVMILSPTNRKANMINKETKDAFAGVNLTGLAFNLDYDRDGSDDVYHSKQNHGSRDNFS